MTTPLDPHLAQILPMLQYGEVAQLTPDAWRGFLRALASSPANPPPPPVADVRDTNVPGPAGTIPVRVYRSAPGPQPTVLFFHGGGWVGGDLDTHDLVVRVLALELECTIVAVHYRRPPEAPFPAAYDDALEATRHVATHLEEFGGAGQPVAIAGDSSGANLAAAVTFACTVEGPKLAAQLLLYPVTDVAGGFKDEAVNARFPSRQENATGYFVTKELTQWSVGHYVSGGSDVDPRVSPLRAPSLADLPPAVVCTAQYDLLRDEGRAYAAALREAGVQVVEHLGDGLVHAYLAMEGASPAVGAEAKRVRASFKTLIAHASRASRD